jgi:hypothetical protein
LEPVRAIILSTDFPSIEDRFDAWGKPQVTDSFDTNTAQGFRAWLQRAVFVDVPRPPEAHPRALQQFQSGPATLSSFFK